MFFSIMAVPVCIPTNGAEKGSLFSTSSPTLVISYLFDNSHSNRCEVTPHCCFDLHFPDD